VNIIVKQDTIDTYQYKKAACYIITYNTIQLLSVVK